MNIVYFVGETSDWEVKDLWGTAKRTSMECFCLFFQRVLDGHVFDVNCCRFFPSGLVVLSGGMDAQLKIWSAEDSNCVVTFKGHKGGMEGCNFSKMLL